MLDQLLLSLTLQGRPECPQDQPRECRKPGVIWCGRDQTLSLDYLALQAAPILWYSPDEPLIGRRLRIPQPLPSGNDQPSTPKGAVVYWQVERVWASAGQEDAVRSHLKMDRLPLKQVQSLILTYFFYYERDFGLNPHEHDLEGIELQIDVETMENGWIPVIVARATGLGHGSELLSNILQIKKSIRQTHGAPDVAVPITVLVEEGKHASCPDRNGDGYYMPGYDVNVKVPDAWGVRDSFGSGFVGSHYQAWMTKPRDPNKFDRVGPKDTAFTTVQAPQDRWDLYPCYRTSRDVGWPEASYELRPAPRCTDDPKGHRDKDFLEDLCAIKDEADLPHGGRHEYPGPCRDEGREEEECTYMNVLGAAYRRFVTEPVVSDSRLEHMFGPHAYLRFFRYLSLSGRFEGTHFGGTLGATIPFGLPKVGGWFTAQYGLLHDDGTWRSRADLSFSPSISRLLDWYVGLGFDWGIRRVVYQADENGDEPGLIARETRDDGWALEGGLQMRHGPWGLRLGLRTALAAGEFRAPRLAGELTWGPQPKHAKIH